MIFFIFTGTSDFFIMSVSMIIQFRIISYFPCAFQPNPMFTECYFAFPGRVGYPEGMEVQKRRKYRVNKKRLIGASVCVALLAAALILALAYFGRAAGRAPYEPLGEEEIQAMRTRALSGGLTETQAALMDAALSIVGDVRYFWGGKSGSVGPDPEWGEIREVVSEGSERTGEMIPYGLDCSGYVTWCFVQLGYSFDEAVELVGNGSWNQWDRSREIRWRELQVGDFAFMNEYPTDQGNHIGICVGFTEKGDPLFAHCAAAFDDVVVTPAGEVFRYARRPALLEG